MIPGMDPKMMKQAMKKLGIKQEELNVKNIIFNLEGEQYLFENPEVVMIDMKGVKTFQITGEYKKIPLEEKIEINEEDIKTVVEQTNTTYETAKKILEETKGDIAEAILKLQEEKNP